MKGSLETGKVEDMLSYANTKKITKEDTRRKLDETKNCNRLKRIYSNRLILVEGRGYRIAGTTSLMKTNK